MTLYLQQLFYIKQLYYTRYKKSEQKNRFIRTQKQKICLPFYSFFHHILYYFIFIHIFIDFSV